MRNTSLIAAGAVVLLTAIAPQPVAPWRSTRAVRGDTTVVQTTLVDPANAELVLQKSGQIGMESGPPEQLLTRVTSVGAARNGAVVFFDGAVHEIRLFDSTLRFVRTVARHGQGPGEIDARILTSANPNIVIQDRTIWSLAFSSQGQVVAFNSPTIGGDRTDGLMLYNRAGIFERSWGEPRGKAQSDTRGFLTPDDIAQITYADWDRNPSLAVSGEPMPDKYVVRFRLNGTVVDTLPSPNVSRIPLDKFYSTTNGPNGTGTPIKRHVRIPFVPYPIVAFNDHGFWMSSHPSSYEVVLHRRTGGPVRITSNSAATPVQTAERRAAFDQYAAPFVGKSPASRVSVNDIPTVKPFVRELRSDPGGRVWVLIHTSAQQSGTRWVEPSVFDIFAPSGEFLGRLKLPAQGSLVATAGKYLWMRERDSLDVERLIRYVISAKSAAAPSADYWRRGG